MNKVQGFLLMIIMVSAVAVVSVRHQNRLAFIALQQKETHRGELQAEWSRLMLEKATWTRQHNVFDAASKSLDMIAPSADKIITLDLTKKTGFSNR